MAGLRREKLEQAAALVAAAGVDVWMVFDRETAEGGDPVLPLILGGGLTWQSALLICGDGRRVAIVGNYDAPPLESSGDWDEVIPYVQGIREALVKTLERLVPDGPVPPKIAVDFSPNDDKADGLSHGMFLLLEEYLRGTRLEGCLVTAEPVVLPLRSRKTPLEISRIRSAIAATEEIFAEVPEFVQAGRSEREIYEAIQARIRGRGLGFSWDPAGDPIVNTGPDSMIGHGIPSSDIRVAPGHVFHLDLGILKDEYASDIQRCWYVTASADEPVPEDVRRAFRAVSGAILAGAAVLRPGVEGWMVDAAARESIQAAGYPEYMHAVGHQVGRMAHDGGATLAPRWERYGRVPYLPVEIDQVYTLELGVMIEGRGYFGLEEMVQVTATGVEWLTRRPDDVPRLTP